MKREYFIPGKDLEKQLWLQNFAAKLPTYAAKYGITAAEVTDTTNASIYFAYWLNYKNQHEGFIPNYAIAISKGNSKTFE